MENSKLKHKAKRDQVNFFNREGRFFLTFLLKKTLHYIFKNKLILFFLIIFVDQFSKHVIWSYYQEVVTLNTKGVFGIAPAWAGLAGVVVLGIVIWKQGLKEPVWYVILGAGVSNLVDRVTYGGVVDFVRIWRFPVFNLADLMISVSVLWLLWKEMRPTHHSGLPL